ncbi:MAG: precorrin-2 dehydrogenase, partial [Candidatus Binatota bacterium]|nr:precorrin-2 dehydrogenase [Candidatus Binatota bacterium]
MSYYPAFLALEGRTTVVVGGGAVAESKVESLLVTGATVRVIAPAVTERLRELAGEGRIEWSQRPHATGDLAGAFMAISATGDPAVDSEVACEARERGVLVNVVDDPQRSDFIAAAVLRRGDLVVAVSTSGAAPAVAARIRDRLASEFGREWQVALELLRAVRG